VLELVESVARQDESVSLGLLRQMVDQNHQQAEDGHGRLRSDVRDIVERLENIEDRIGKVCGRVAMMEQTIQQPVDLSRVTMTPKIVGGIIAACIGMYASVWGANWGLRENVATVLTRMESRDKLDDERHAVILKTIDDMKKRQELAEIEIRNLAKGLR
jgi:hypothetical protein